MARQPALELSEEMYRYGDKGNVVQFGHMPVENTFLTAKENRPVFFKALCAVVTSPAAKNQKAVLEIHLMDEAGKILRRKVDTILEGGKTLYRDEMFKEQLKAWREQRRDEDALGTGIQAWEDLDIQQIAALRALDINTLEQLMNVSDADLYKLGPNGRETRNGAKAFLESRNSKKPYAEVTAKNADLQRQLEELQAQMASILTAQASPTPQPKKRGPKPKGSNNQAQAAA